VLKERGPGLCETFLEMIHWSTQLAKQNHKGSVGLCRARQGWRGGQDSKDAGVEHIEVEFPPRMPKFWLPHTDRRNKRILSGLPNWGRVLVPTSPILVLMDKCPPNQSISHLPDFVWKRRIELTQQQIQANECSLRKHEVKLEVTLPKALVRWHYEFMGYFGCSGACIVTMYISLAKWIA